MSQPATQTTAYVKQTPGWWPALQHAHCDECGRTGPTRNTSSRQQATLLRLDCRWHRCDNPEASF